MESLDKLFELPQLFTLSGTKVTDGWPKEELLNGPCGNGSGRRCTSCSNGSSMLDAEE